MKLSQYLRLDEALSQETGESKRAVFTFGRFNPPTKGHEKLINKVIALAGSDDHFIFPSHSKDTNKDPAKVKNPLDSRTKVDFMQHLFPQANVVYDETIKNAFQVMGYLGSHGYTDLVFVVGSDRVPEFKKRMSKALEYFDTFHIESAGARDPDSDDAVTRMSATAAREAALKNDIAAFRTATGWSGDISRQLMDAVRDGMNG